MNHLFEILNIDNSTIIVIGKTYYGIDDYISELETELAKRHFRGEIIFDLLLANGLYAKNRFIHSSYYGDRIIDFDIISTKNVVTKYEKYIKNFYRKNINILNNGILLHKDIAILKKILTLP